MRALTDFPWDRLHVFEPYSSRARIESAMGFAWPNADATGIDVNDGVSLLVFVQNGAVVRYVVQPRSEGDFSNAYLIHLADLDAKSGVECVLRFGSWRTTRA